jgi:hypothetical protein
MRSQDPERDRKKGQIVSASCFELDKGGILCYAIYVKVIRGKEGGVETSILEVFSGRTF